jgi:hypothetical protein
MNTPILISYIFILVFVCVRLPSKKKNKYCKIFQKNTFTHKKKISGVYQKFLNLITLAII